MQNSVIFLAFLIGNQGVIEKFEQNGQKTKEMRLSLHLELDALGYNCLIV